MSIGETIVPSDWIQYGAFGILSLVIVAFVFKWVPAIASFIERQFTKLGEAIKESSASVTRDLTEQGKRQESGIGEIRVSLKAIDDKITIVVNKQESMNGTLHEIRGKP